MIYFTILLGLALLFLFFWPHFRKSANRNLIAGKSSACGCFGLLLFLFSLFYSAKTLDIPASMVLLFLIAFLSVPVIAILFSAWLAIRIHENNSGEGKPPLMRTVLFFVLLSILGTGIWIAERSAEVNKVSECGRFSVDGTEFILRKKLLSPILERYSYSLAAGTKQINLPPSYDGARIVNLYWLPSRKGNHPGLLILADSVSVTAFDPATQEMFSLTGRGDQIFLNEKDVPSWNIPDHTKYLGMFSGKDFISPQRQKGLPLSFQKQESAAGKPL